MPLRPIFRPVRVVGVRVPLLEAVLPVSSTFIVSAPVPTTVNGPWMLSRMPALGVGGGMLPTLTVLTPPPVLTVVTVPGVTLVRLMTSLLYSPPLIVAEAAKIWPLMEMILPAWELAGDFS